MVSINIEKVRPNVPDDVFDIKISDKSVTCINKHCQGYR